MDDHFTHTYFERYGDNMHKEYSKHPDEWVELIWDDCTARMRNGLIYVRREGKNKYFADLQRLEDRLRFYFYPYHNKDYCCHRIVDWVLKKTDKEILRFVLETEELYRVIASSRMETEGDWHHSRWCNPEKASSFYTHSYRCTCEITHNPIHP